MVIGKTECSSIGSCVTGVMDFLSTADPGRAIILAALLGLAGLLLWFLLKLIVSQFLQWRYTVQGLTAIEREIGYNLANWRSLFSEEQRAIALDRLARARADGKDFTAFATPAAANLFTEIARPTAGSGFTRQFADYYCSASYLTKAVASLRGDEFRKLAADDQVQYVNQVFDAGRSATEVGARIKRDVAGYLELIDFGKIAAIYAMLVIALFWLLRS